MLSTTLVTSKDESPSAGLQSKWPARGRVTTKVLPYCCKELQGHGWLPYFGIPVTCGTTTVDFKLGCSLAHRRPVQPRPEWHNGTPPCFFSGPTEMSLYRFYLGTSISVPGYSCSLKAKPLLLGPICPSVKTPRTTHSALALSSCFEFWCCPPSF